MRSELENRLLEIINGGTCEGFGDVDGYGKYVSLVEDVDDMDYVVIQDQLGFVYVEEFEHIDIDDNGYCQPARKRFEQERELWEAWQGDDDYDFERRCTDYGATYDADRYNEENS